MEYHSGGSLPLLGRPRYCPGANANGGYLCETGHCCGESGCCTYYYELWWFWLLWTVLILFSCCCAYRHRRAKLRVQQQQRQRDISLLAYQGASSFPSSMLDLSFLASLKLPSYEEVAAQPSTPPPPYSSVFTAPRYPQPPRAAHPHLLSQHPGGAQHPGALHRPLQPLSDGPSSLSSDNSSSCSCDSCCPSSPCSSSLSAPVTYETDTSHASTPSEATPLALDPVAMETISAAAARLAPALGSKDDPSTVAILIERTEPAVTERVTAIAAGSASPSETKASPDLDATFPGGITAPIKQQLDITPTMSAPTLQSTEHCASSPDASSNLTRTLDNTSSKQPRTLTLILDSVGGNTDKNPSLVPISVSPQNPPRAVFSDETHTSQTDSKISENSPNTSPSQARPPSRTVHSIDTRQSPNNATDFTDRSSPSQGIAHFLTKPAEESLDLTVKAPSVTTESEETGYVLKSPSINAPVSSTEDTKNLQDIFGHSKQTCELSKTTETVATNSDQSDEKSDTNALGNSSLLQSATHLSESVAAPLESSHPAQTSSQRSQSLKSEATTSSAIPTTPREPSRLTESTSVSMPDPLSSECPTISSSQAATDERKETSSPEKCSASLQLYTEIPLLTQDPSAQPTMKANSSATEAVSPTCHQETERMSTMNSDIGQNPVHSELLLANSSDPSTSFAAITIQTDRPSFASVISPTFDRETGKVSATNLDVEQERSDSELLNSEHSLANLDTQNENSNSRENVTSSLQLHVEIPPLKPDLSAQPTTKANAFSADGMLPSLDRETGKLFVTKPADSELVILEHSLANVATQSENSNPSDASSFVPVSPPSFASVLSPTVDQETGRMSTTNIEVVQKAADSELLSLEHSLMNMADVSFFPAITIHADPPSFAASPCSIPSPSLPQSPSGAMLLLDPLAALQPSEKSAASSGHASSLSPSPRNTQSPPKQTLFSPCVDVFEPVNPSWEDDESEEQPDEEYCEDSDVAADESQYRHRRLTGDSGIEVCRCRVEDEEEEDEEEEMEKAKKQDGGEKKSVGGAALHDSVDCPVRSRKSSSGEDGLCGSDTSSETVVIPVETV